MKSSTAHASPADAAIAAKLSRGDVFSADCPAREVLRNVTSRWGVLVLIALRGGGTLRFSEIRRKIGGVSEKMLAQTLQALEADGFVRRTSRPVVPPHVEYDLTDMGQEMSAQIADLTNWIETNLGKVMAARVASA